MQDDGSVSVSWSICIRAVCWAVNADEQKGKDIDVDVDEQEEKDKDARCGDESAGCPCEWGGP